MTITDVEPAAPAVDEFDPTKVYEELTDEEMALVAIMTDPSGIDQAEFTWVDNNPHPDGTIDGCFRCHPFQWPWWQNRDERQIDQAARDVGKSTRIQARSCAFPFIYPGQEMAITAPEGTHLDKLTDALEVRIYASWLLTQMVIGGRGGIRHRPFRLMWASGARLYCMLPQRSGLGVKGSHCVWLDCDEGQDITERTWRELPETVRWEVPGATWLIHGVSKGVIDDFYKMTQEGSGWTVHRITSMHSPFWSEAERVQKIKDYGGSRDNPDYLRNVNGEHGPAMNRIFVLTRLMACQDSIESSRYNTEEYYKVQITDDHVAARVGSKEDVAVGSDRAIAALHEMLDFPRMHEHYDVTWAGMDIGLVSDPSELLVFGEYELSAAERRENLRHQIAVPEPGDSRFKLLTRLKLLRLPEPLQVELIMWVIGFYRPRAFAMDKTGMGAPILQALQHRAGTSRLFVIEPPEDATDAERRDFEEQRSQARNALTVIKGYNFKEKVLIDFDEGKVAELGPNPSMQEMIDKAGIKQTAKDRATDVLRSYVDNSRLLIPNDAEVLNDFNAQTWQYAQEPVDAYGKRRMTYAGGSFHVLDGARMFALGQSQAKIEQIVATPVKQEPVYDLFLRP